MLLLPSLSILPPPGQFKNLDLLCLFPTDSAGWNTKSLPWQGPSCPLMESKLISILAWLCDHFLYSTNNKLNVLSHFSHVRLFCDPMDCSPPGSSVHGILQARTLEWVAVPSSRGSSWPRDREAHVSYISCIGKQVLYQLCHLGNPLITNRVI